MKKFSIAMLSMVLAGSMLLTGCGGSKTVDSSSDAQDSHHLYLCGRRHAAHGH